ncbi:hypothetical protein HON59_02960 [bacterium]|jgi:hypothetical protein|nr:hypothetical protein [bacterium]MBT4894992.1 hypothetical protein [bacterium]
MQTIEIKTKIEDKKGWVFGVRVDGVSHKVDVKKGDYERLTGGKVTPEELVEKSFKFLLAREPKEAILKSFNIMEIQRYFPEYESEMSR